MLGTAKAYRVLLDVLKLQRVGRIRLPTVVLSIEGAHRLGLQIHQPFVHGRLPLLAEIVCVLAPVLISIVHAAARHDVRRGYIATALASGATILGNDREWFSIAFELRANFLLLFKVYSSCLVLAMSIADWFEGPCRENYMLSFGFCNRLCRLLRVSGLFTDHISAGHPGVLFHLCGSLWFLKLVPRWPMIILVLQGVGPLRCADLDRLFV